MNSESIVALSSKGESSWLQVQVACSLLNEYCQSSELRASPTTFWHCTFTQAKLSLRLEYIPPKPGKSVEGEITATDETDLGAELDDEFGLEEEGMDELEGGGAAGVSETAR